ncbi:MAG: hypothetical protein ACOYWZ_10130 [Bacillota bacterium]
MQKWWTCPKCRGHKMVDEKAACIRCPECGRYFDGKDKEIQVNVSLDDMKPIGIQCDLN